MAEEWRQLVGEAIRARRHELGIGPMDFAGRLHVSVKTIERYERGESDGALRQLDEIAKVLETTPEALTTHAGERAERGETPDVLGSLDSDGPSQLDEIEAKIDEALELLRGGAGGAKAPSAGQRTEPTAEDEDEADLGLGEIGREDEAEELPGQAHGQAGTPRRARRS